MSEQRLTLEAALDQRQAEALKPKEASVTRQVSLMLTLAAVLAGPTAAVPLEDPRRPRDPAAWHPPARGHEPLEGGTPGVETKPKVYLSAGASPDPNDYLRRRQDGTYEFANRLKDRRRQLEKLLLELGLPCSARQVKRIMKGIFPAKLEAWLDAQKAQAEGPSA